MTAEQFTYWMQGFAELSGDAPPTLEQWRSIRAHLATVFVKVTPPAYIPQGPQVYPTIGTPPTQIPMTGIPAHWPPARATCSAIGTSSDCISWENR